MPIHAGARPASRRSSVCCPRSSALTASPPGAILR